MLQQTLRPGDTTPGLARSAWTHATALPFVILGAIGIIGGGLLSAVLAPMASYHGNWAVAYIVLIPGVAQAVMGVAQTSLTGGRVRSGIVAAEAVAWNLGAVATLAGTLLNITPVLYAGAVLQVGALVVFLTATRHARNGSILVLLRVLIATLLVSVPIGIILQALTH